MLDLILSFLEADHIKQLRLTCRYLRSAAIRHITHLNVGVTRETQPSELDSQLSTLSFVTHVALCCVSLENLASVLLGSSLVLPLLRQLFIQQ